MAGNVGCGRLLDLFENKCDIRSWGERDVISVFLKITQCSVFSEC